MFRFVESLLDAVDVFLSWMSSGLKQTMESYCELQTADSEVVLVSNDGSLLSILEVEGVKSLIGEEEFIYVKSGVLRSLRTAMSRPGHKMQVYFYYDRAQIKDEIRRALKSSVETTERLSLNLTDIFNERVENLSNYCATERVHIVLWTKPAVLTNEQYKKALKEKMKLIKQKKIPSFKFTQNILAAIPDLRDVHDSFVRAVVNDMNGLGILTRLLPIHDAVGRIRMSVDSDFTDKTWQPCLPGDNVVVKEYKKFSEDISDILWPPLFRQILPRDAENVDLRTVRIGDKIYSSIFIDLFPKDIQKFHDLLFRTLPTGVPWRISFLVDSDGLSSVKLKSALTSVLSWSSAQNRLINDSLNLLKYIKLNTDDSVVRLRVTATTWADEGNVRELRVRASQLARAVEGWGYCDVSENSGDAFAGVMSSALGVTGQSVATTSVAPLSDVIHILPLFRPASPWKSGAMLFRSLDGKLWPYQPGSSEQITWVDLIYAKPGSGKSVLSNAINFALCMANGLVRLPRISIIDIGPSSSGLISLLKEALPKDKLHLVAYHRLKMTSDFAINPFDTQLGCRFPTPQDRGFLVNFITLLLTPVGADKAYDGISDMIGLIVDEMYKKTAEAGFPNKYTIGTDELIDGILEEIGFIYDPRTSWWEVVDALFVAGFEYEALLAQRYAVPTLSDSIVICRSKVVEDLYIEITTPTGENLIDAFSRMISAAIREYPVLSKPTKFDIGAAKVVVLDLDEVAKSGGDAANRQTAVMYMLARYVLARDFYLNEENLPAVNSIYMAYHEQRIIELREDPKRLVLDEFHRTAHSPIVRQQVIVDMREGRKWKVQIGLISQSLEDFDSLMVEFATSIFIMDAGTEQAIKKTSAVFGLSETAQNALRNYVHGPSSVGSTFLGIFSTKEGNNTQILAATIGPIELWAFNTTAEDSLIRNRLYMHLGPAEARRILGNIFPTGSAMKYIENVLAKLRKVGSVIDENAKVGVIDKIVRKILTEYAKNRDFKYLIPEEI